MKRNAPLFLLTFLLFQASPAFSQVNSSDIPDRLDRTAFLFSPELNLDPYSNYSYYPGYFLPGDTANMQKRRGMIWIGATAGFATGGLIGVGFGLLGEEWTLNCGLDTVSRGVHSIVDAIIFGTPTLIIGSVIGARHRRSTLSPSNFHIGIHGGYSVVQTYTDMQAAFEASGYDSHIPHWFGYLHYPNGAESSVPYSYNVTVDYNIVDPVSVGLGYNRLFKQKIGEGLTSCDTGEVQEWSYGQSYTLVADWIINPIKPTNKLRTVASLGVGFALNVYTSGGEFGSENSDWRYKETNISPYLRGALEYYSRKNLSLQLKLAYRTPQEISVPLQTDGVDVLLPHDINFRVVEITIGIRYHLDLGNKDED